MKNIVILISGRGSNMEAIVRACAERRRGRAHRRGASATAPTPPAWRFARGARHRHRGRRPHARSRRATRFDAELARSDRAHSARRRRAWPASCASSAPDFVRRFDGRLVNIHPSLLPAFPGLHTHRRAIDAGCKVAGASVHFVTADLDHGPIIGQAVVPVLADDSEASARRAGARARSIGSIRGRSAGWSTSALELRATASSSQHRDGEPQLLRTRPSRTLRRSSPRR